jgi:hypothetical protein
MNVQTRVSNRFATERGVGQSSNDGWDGTDGGMVGRVYTLSIEGICGSMDWWVTVLHPGCARCAHCSDLTPSTAKELLLTSNRSSGLK